MIDQKKQLPNDLGERFAQKEFGCETDDAESEQDQKNRKEDCADFRVHLKWL